MALEPDFRFIDDLVPANPLATDPVAEGDNHLGGIKNALKANITGNATETRLVNGGVVRTIALANSLRVIAAGDTAEVDGYDPTGATKRFSLLHQAGLVTLQNHTLAGVLRAAVLGTSGLQTQFSATPDGESFIGYAGLPAVRAESDGASAQTTVAGGAVFRFRSSAGVLHGSVGSTTARMDITQALGTEIRLNIGAATGVRVIGGAGGGVQLFHDDNLRASVIDAGMVVRGNAADAATIDLAGSGGEAGGDIVLAPAYYGMISRRPGANLTLWNADTATRRVLEGVPGAETRLFTAGLEYMATAASAAARTAANSGGTVSDGAATKRAVGFNVMPPRNVNTMTISAANISERIRFTAAAQTLTLAALAAGATIVVANVSAGNLTVTDGVTTVSVLTGGAVVPATSFTLLPGSECRLFWATTTVVEVIGNGVTVP